MRAFCLSSSPLKYKKWHLNVRRRAGSSIAENYIRRVNSRVRKHLGNNGNAIHRRKVTGVFSRHLESFRLYRRYQLSLSGEDARNRVGVYCHDYGFDSNASVGCGNNGT